jgi:hypothetical protein
MDEVRLRSLLTQQEGANLEFKQEFYKLRARTDEGRKREQAELIKDILALANGNANVAGETSYLIVGVGDTRNSDGSREIYGVGGVTLKANELLQMVNGACEPPIEDLECDIIPIDGKNLLVITIPPSPHLHETTADLVTPKRTFTERTVLIRRNESVEVASARDRAAIQTLKTLRLDERKNMPPVLGGMVTGAVVGRLLGEALASQSNDKLQRRVYNALGIIVGGVLGGLVGNSWRGFLLMRKTIQRTPAHWRPVVLGAGAGSVTGFAVFFSWLLKKAHDKLVVGRSYKE